MWPDLRFDVDDRNTQPRRLVDSRHTATSPSTSERAGQEIKRQRVGAVEFRNDREAEEANGTGPWNVYNACRTLGDITSVKREKSNRFGQAERRHCKVDTFQPEHRPADESPQSRRN